MTKYKFKKGDIFIFDEKDVDSKWNQPWRFRYIGLITGIRHVSNLAYFDYELIRAYDDYHKRQSKSHFQYDSNVYNYSKIITEEELTAILL